MKIKKQPESSNSSPVGKVSCLWWKGFVKQVHLKPQMKEKINDNSYDFTIYI